MKVKRQTMKNERNRSRVPARFGRETRFALPVEPVAPFRATQPTEFELLKDRLLKEHLDLERQPELYATLRRAANDAAALAWAEPFPLLVLPELFREKTTAAKRYAGKQATLRRGVSPAMEPEVAA